MSTNVLPLFWHLASSSKDTRLAASSELVAAIQDFQAAFAEVRASAPDDADEEDEDDEDDEDEADEDDDESGIEVDHDEQDEDEPKTRAEDARLDRELARDNAEDVVYCVKRLVRGLGSSRESSRLGFAVALTELLARVPTVTPAQTLSLLVRESRWSAGMKGADERDALFARLFGLVALVNSGALFRPSSTSADFVRALERFAQVGDAKPWLRESVGWAVIGAVRVLLDSDVAWQQEGVQAVVEQRVRAQPWTQDKVALVIVLQEARPELDWKALLAPTFKYPSILAAGNLVTLGRILKESGSDDDDGVDASTGSWKPQLHFVWNIILDAYFAPAAGSALERAPFQDLFRVVVDESFFANASSVERKYHGFQIFTRALALVPPGLLPQIFTPNLMRSWMNALTASDRHLHKIALATARHVSDVAAASPAVGFTLLSQLVGKHGRPDFDKVTRTKTVEGIMSSLSVEGVKEYVDYLQAVVVGKGETTDAAALEDRRVWALDQLLALCRNGSVPKDGSWVGPLLDFLLVHGFFIIRKADKKSPIAALHATPKPALTETTAAVARARLVSVLVEVTSFQPKKDAKDAKADGPVAAAGAGPRPAQAVGCDTAGVPWVRRVLATVGALEADGAHVEPAADADAEIRAIRARAAAALDAVRTGESDRDVRRGAEVLLSFLVLQTYDEVEDALDMLEEAVDATARLFEKKGKKSKAALAEDDTPPIDTLLDTLVQLLDKGSADLRALANLVFGLVSSALTESGIKHLVAQLEATAAEAAEQESDEDVEDDDNEASIDGADEDADEDADDDDDDEEDSEDGDAVDPEFRKRVAAALQVSGLGVDEDATAGEGDEDEDEEAWDDEQMMKVDAQLAAVFRERAGTSKRADLKHLQIENLHFKLRVLDLVDTYLRRQPTSPLSLLLVVPLLNLVRRAGPSEAELATKATSIIRARLGRANHYPEPSLLALPILDEIHAFARHAASAELSALASAASLFVARAVVADDDETDAVAATYGTTLADFVGRKASSVHPPFLLEFARRHPLRAWRIRAALVAAAAPGAGVNAFRQQAVYSLLGALAGQLAVIAKARPADEVRAFVAGAAAQVYATLEDAAAMGEFKADRLKEVVKFALGLARASKAAGVAWDAQRLRDVEQTVRDGKTKSAAGVVALVKQLVAVVVGKEGKEGKEGKRKEADGDVDMDAPAEDGEGQSESADKPKKRKAGAADKAKPDGAKVKKAKMEAGADGAVKKAKKAKAAKA
ncbi:DNA-directed DNA polymerase [Cryptotrichosporon argae]